MAVRAIVHVISSARDVNGNCYHAARIVNTANGASIVVQTDGPNNPRSALMGYTGMLWDEVYQMEQTLPKKQWQKGPGLWPVVWGTAERKLYTALFNPDNVCPDGPQCADPKCHAERVARDIL